MATVLAVQQNKQTQIAADIERALIGGDLKDLNPEGRLEFYRAVCNSLGLNPLTKPFEYITLNGKLTLYAKRDCADQLRKINSVSITNLEAKQIGGLFVCTATATDGKGRTDTSTGAVSTDGLKGENLANAMMKAETKAKRRVTLSLCGLGLLDESEVETIPDARPHYEPPPAPVTAPSQKTPAQIAPAPAVQPNYTPHIEGNILISKVRDVLEKTTAKGKPYLVVRLDAKVDGHDGVFCWHASLFDALRFTPGNACQFEIEERNGKLSISDVLDVGGQEFRGGKPFNPDAEDPTFITNDDLPKEMFHDDIPF